MQFGHQEPMTLSMNALCIGSGPLDTVSVEEGSRVSHRKACPLRHGGITQSQG